MASPDEEVSWHPEILGRVQRGVLRRLGPAVTQRGFYLAGGTAIAAYLGHRRSVDLDWFTSGSLADPQHLANELNASDLSLVPYLLDLGTLHARMSGVRVSFLEFHYPLLEPLAAWPELASAVASLDDLSAMKLSAVAQRGSKRDFVDIFALIREHKPLSELLRLYQQKYAAPEIGHVLYALTYFDEADRERSPVMRWDVDWRMVKRAIQAAVRDLAR